MGNFALCGATNIPKINRLAMTKVLPLILAAVLCAGALPALAQSDGKGLSEATLYDMLLGEIAQQRGDHELAAKTFLNVARRTRDPRIARRAVEVASKGKQPALALEAARTWLELEPASSQALQVLAAMLIADKRVDEAEPYLERLFAAPGASPENGFLRLDRLLAGNPDKAANLRVVRRLAARFPQLPHAHFALAQAAAAAGDDAGATASARQALVLRPDWEPAALFEAQVLQKRSMAEAAARLGEFVARNPASREVRLAYARALLLDRRYAEARTQFEAVLAANPGNAEVVYSVALLAFQLKDHAAADEYLKRLLAMKPQDPAAVRYLLGQVAEEQKRWDDAVEWYRQISEGDHLMPARLRTANALAKQGRLDEARAYLQRLAAENPNDRTQLMVAEAQILRDASRHREAFDMLGEALRAEPEQADLLYDFALTAEKLDRFDLAEDSLRRLMKLKPDHAHAYNALGYSLAERNLRLPEARKLIERAVELAPQDFYILDSLGWVQYREGDIKGAAATLRRAYEGRQDAEIGAHLGEVLWVLGERDEARRIWQESLKAAPENETLQKTLKRFQP
jgi:tetratricopeptide (TPR) repeat protein